MSDLFAAYKEVVGDAVERLVFGFCCVRWNGLHGEQAAHGDFLSIFQSYDDIGGVIDRVSLGWHAALGTVDGVIEIVTGEYDGEVDPICDGIVVEEIKLTGAGLQANRFGELGIRRKAIDLFFAGRNGFQ